jgi:hypothetical protein
MRTSRLSKPAFLCDPAQFADEAAKKRTDVAFL